MITEIWTEATTDDDGRYRLYAQADVYDIQVRIPGVGAARRSRTPLGADEAKSLDIALERGVTFRAEVVDSLTGDPVPGVRLWHSQHRGVEGRSKEDGIVEVPDMMPGPFQFEVEAPGYARWWSEEASTEWSRRKIDETRGGWQRNFDHIDFEPPARHEARDDHRRARRDRDWPGRRPRRQAGRRGHGRPGLDRHRQLADRRYPVQRRDRQGRPVQGAPAGQRATRVQPRRPRRQVRPVADLGQRRAPAVPDQAGRGHSPTSSSG